MKNTTEIHTIVDTASLRLRNIHSPAYACGYFQSTLAHVIDELMRQNPEAAERFITRLESL
jgi:hypothetical protein